MKKEFRVKSHEDFQEVINCGKSKASRYFVMYYCPKKFEHDRIGISVGKKLGNAVERNLVKRQVRMMIDETSDYQSGFDRIFIVRAKYKMNDYSTNKKDLSVLYNSVYNKQGQTY